MPSYRKQELFHDLREGVPDLAVEDRFTDPGGDEYTGKLAEMKVFHGAVYAGHEDFATLQDALDYADANNHGTILVPNVNTDGGYGAIAPYSGQRIVGINHYVRIDGGTTGHAVDLTTNDAGYIQLENLNFQTTAGAGNAYDGVHIDGQGNVLIENCLIAEADRDGIRLGDSATTRYVKIMHCQGTNSIDGYHVNFQANADRNIVDTITASAGWSVNDVGTRNLVGDVTS